MVKMEAPRGQGAAASETIYAGKLERPEDKPNSRRNQRFSYYDHPVAAKLIAISIARCGGTWRVPS
jgi:hypothetical protein